MLAMFVLQARAYFINVDVDNTFHNQENYFLKADLGT